MAIYNVSSTGTKTSGDSPLNDWSNGDTYNISALSAVLRTAMEAGNNNEVVINDGSYEFSSTVLSCSGWTASSNKLFIIARTSSVTLEMASSSRFAIINHGSAAFKFEFIDVFVGRVASVNHTLNTSGATLFTIAGSPDSIIFRGGGISRAHIDTIGVTGGFGLTHSISGSAAKTIEFIGYDRANLSITQLQGGTSSSLGIAGSVHCNAANAIVIYDGVTASSLDTSSDINLPSIDNCINGEFRLAGDVDYSDVTSIGTGTVGGGLEACMQTTRHIIQSLSATFSAVNVNIDAQQASCFGLKLSGTHALDGKLYGRDCHSLSYQNAVGGLFLASGAGAQGTVGDIYSEDCSSAYGSAFYLSNGAGTHARSVVALRNKNLGSTVYKGGFGDGVIDSCTVVGNMKFPENPHQQSTASRESVVYGHAHSTSTTRNCSFHIGSLYLEGNEDSVINDDEYLIVARNPNPTFTFTMTIDRLITAESVDARKISAVFDIASAGVTLAIANHMIMPSPPKQYVMIAPGISVAS